MLRKGDIKRLTAALLASATALTCASPMRAGAEDQTVKQKPLFADYYGDMDLDDAVTSDDALAILRMSMQETEDIPDMRTFKRADVDLDGAVTSGDAMLVLRESVGIDALSVKYYDTAVPIDTDTEEIGDHGTDTDETDTAIGEPNPDTSSDVIDPPDTSTEEPDTSSDEPDTNTEEPDTDTEDTDTTIGEPNHDTSSDVIDPPDTSTEEPDTSSDEPDTSTEEPDTDTEDTDTTIGEPNPDTSSDVIDPPEPDTEEPDTNTDEPDTSTDRPERDHSKSLMDEDVINGINDFAVKLFLNTIKDSDENSFMSPISAYVALAMLGNGADGNTRDELMRSLGFTESDDVPVMNENLGKYISAINGGAFTMANSMFIMEDNGIRIKPEYEQLLREIYSAEMFNEPANDDTVDLINKWISDNTDGMLKDVIPYGSLSEATASLLINAAMFDADWVNDYPTEYGDYYTKFYNIDGTTTDVKMLGCEERLYLDDGRATGFVKSYSNWYFDENGDYHRRDENYSFIAILPNEDVGIDNYLASMDGNTLRNLLNTQRDVKTHTRMPKFKYECSYDLGDPMKDMGVEDVFDRNKSDLSQTCEDYPLFVSKITQDTYIEVNECGTRAAAATVIYEDIGACPEEPEPEEEKYVYCDRPYIYVIYDNNNDIPLFIGAIKSMEGVEIPEVEKPDYDDYDDEYFWGRYW